MWMCVLAFSSCCMIVTCSLFDACTFVECFLLVYMFNVLVLPFRIRTHISIESE